MFKLICDNCNRAIIQIILNDLSKDDIYTIDKICSCGNYNKISISYDSDKSGWFIYSEMKSAVDNV